MNKRGQMGLGAILVMFIAVIVGLILFVAIAQQVGESTNTIDLDNYNITASTVGSNTSITGYKFLGGTITVTNNSGATLNAGNYTITNNQIADGALVVNFWVDDDAEVDALSVWTLNSSAAQETDYISDSAARSIAGLITIFFALAVAVIVLGPTIKEGLQGLGV